MRLFGTLSVLLHVFRGSIKTTAGHQLHRNPEWLGEVWSLSVVWENIKPTRVYRVRAWREKRDREM